MTRWERDEDTDFHDFTLDEDEEDNAEEKTEARPPATWIQQLFQKILSDAALKSRIPLSQDPYAEEPIIFPASKMKNYMPIQYAKMKKMAQKYYRVDVLGNEKLFYQQAQFMEDFEDDFDGEVDFSYYYPTYMTMNDRQLRRYFSWRTKVRKGCIEPTSLSYVFVYLYELLQLIGVKDARDGFETLLRFWQQYRQHESVIDFYLGKWLPDFIVYYRLEPSLFERLPKKPQNELLLTLVRCQTETDERLFDALDGISSYKIKKSKFYAAYPHDLCAVVCRTFRLLDVCDENRPSTLFDLYGERVYESHRMFAGTIFYRTHRDSYSYPVDETLTYRCTDGYWQCDRLELKSRKNDAVGRLLKTVEGAMRKHVRYKYSLKTEPTQEIVRTSIEQALREFDEEKRKSRIAEVSIDFSQLDAIRTASERTREKLIVEEEDGEEPTVPPTEQPMPAPPAEDTAPKKTEGDPFDLTDSERDCLLAFLNGGSPKEAAKRGGVMLSLLIDSINEKLFDRFGDAVILYEGDEPQLTEDYSLELKEIFIHEDT